MDSYDLFGDDGSSMLEGLPDLGGNHTYAGNPPSSVTGDTKESSDSSYRQAYSQSSGPPEGSLPKLASFGSGGGGLTSGSQAVPGGGGATDYHEYGGYAPPRPRMPPPHGPPLHSAHHVHPGHSYAGYHPAPDPMYSMPEHPGMTELGVWSSAPGSSRYPPITPGYRHPYDHQKIHQYPPQQGMQGVPQNGAYLPRQPHFPQPPSQSVYSQQQNYPGYPQVHPSAPSRLGPHAPYHQQMELNPHQYSISHAQQNLPNVPPQHQPHQGMSSHQNSMASNLQGSSNVHLHHAASPALHHGGRQPPPAPTSVSSGHNVPSQAPYSTAHHSVPLNYQPHQLQPSLDVTMGVTSQYGTQKPPGLDSPQYRPPFQQLSPQISPRAQMSPRPQAPPQLSPRPPISPVKGPNASPHAARAVPPPISSGSQNNPSFNTQNTLQALEQMVLPTAGEYAYQRNPASPVVGHMVPSPSQWNQPKMNTPTNPIQIQTENIEKISVTSDSIVIPAISGYNEQNRKNVMNENKSVDFSHKIETIDNTEDEEVGIPNSGIIKPSIVDGPIGTELGKDSNTQNDKVSSPEIQANFKIGDNDLSVEESLVNKENTNDQVGREKNIDLKSNITEETSGIEIAISQPSSLQPVLSNVQGPTHESNAPIVVPQLNVSQPSDISNTRNMQSSTNTMPIDPQGLSMNRNVAYPANSLLSNMTANISSVLNPSRNQSFSSDQANRTTQSMQPSLLQNISSNFPSTMPNQNISNTSPVIGQINSNNILNVPQTNVNITTQMVSNVPAVQTSNPTNLHGVLPTPSITTNIPTTVGNIPPTMSPNLGVQMNMPLGIHSGIPPNNQNIMPPLPHGLSSNIPMMMGPGLMPHAAIAPVFPTPISHQQERAALQQQIQEIYCMPPTPETQEKLQCLQERLAMLQQHETNEKCNGGPNCILQNPVYGSKMVESPQVSSTTGRGRSRGASRPRKPRAKKDKTAVSQPLDELPVSEDCVTAGTGLHITNLDVDGEFNEDVTNLDGSVVQYDVNSEGKVKKPRRKYKERKPRVPKEPKPKPDKPIKERKKREPKDPNAPRRKRASKKDEVDVQADTTTSYEFSESNETITKENSFTFSELNSERSMRKVTEPPKTEDGSVTDFDDIPVSKIPIKELLEEAEARREIEDKEDDTDSLCQSGSKRKVTKRKSIGNISCRKSGSKRLSGGRKKKRGGIVPESDGEPDDLMSTPPPSPPAEADCDGLKRRSARNTHRKKYTDDVMLRLSDEEFSAAGIQKSDKNLKLEQSNIEIKDLNKAVGLPIPNYIYVNTTDEDSMIVQHVLASRMGKRELKPDAIQEKNQTDLSAENATDENAINDNATETTEITDIKEEVATEKIDDSETITNNIKDAEENNVVIEKEIQPENSIDVSQEISAEIQKNDTIDVKNEKAVLVDIEEFYVKYRNFSYLHCEWKTEDELYKGDKRIFSKIKRFKQKQAQQVNIFELLDDEPFNPDYIEVERILDMSDTVDPGNENSVKHYLVKWKSLQYEDSTWELEEDIDVDKIRQFEIFHDIPPKDKWKFKRKPPAEHWSQLKESPLYKGGNTLRPYQLEGLNWLLFSWHNNRNCILADEMGLGKTIQSLTFVNSIWEYGIRGPFLIIAPLSTIPNWQREFEGWTDMNVIVYHGSQQSKSMIQEYEFYYKSEGVPMKEITKFNVLITTFEIIVTDFQDLKTFNWRACVIDEAHRLKNRNCKLLEGLRQLHMEHRVLLSGTPLQNNVNELFSLLNFLEPAQFSSSDAFLSEFGQLKSESEVIKLQALLKPMMLRRLKEDVEKGLAPKEETIIEVELTNIQKKYYRAILERNFSFLRKGTNSAANIPNLMNTMMELRKCCIHPYLLNGAEDQIQFDYKQANGEDKQAYYEALIQSSGKMVLVDKLLPKLKAGGHRVLIFSQMVRCLDILEDYLMFRKYPYERIDGRIRGNLRQEAIDRFSKPDSDRFVFLLCTKAGGLGINLTAADTVIIYDSDWNPQNDLQAQARCHRIGQQKMVKIYRLICRNSYEREMFDKASLKLGLDKAVLQSMNTSQGKETGLRQLSKKEIEDLLKKGAYGAVMDEDNAGDKFCEEDIEMILARRTQVIQMESEKGSTFSKASFAANDQRSDIDIRDPDFWNKWAKKAEIDPTEKNEEEDLIVTEPRRRTLIKRYGHDDSTMEMSDMDATPDSDDDEEGISLRSRKKKDRLGRKGRKYTSDDYVPRHESMAIDDEVIYGSWTRSECFKIERGLLTYGWARWDEIVDKNQFRKGWTLSVIEDCARIIVLYCLRHYKGDEKIRNFIWDLIEPCENGEVTISRNHSGLHNPVPRGRNAKKKNKPKDVPKPSAVQKWEDPSHWSSGEKYDCEAYLEGSYKKHLFRHANKVLLRVRMMYYIKHEVIGDYATQIEAAVHASGLGMRVPRGVDSAPPRIWWDSDCDVSLLVGTYVHGYENYLAMRSDPQLCFVDKLGPPDDAECTDIKSEERLVHSRGGDEDCTDDVSSGAGASPAREDDAAHPWPSMQDLNTRLRRLITAYQRNYKREELKMQQRAKTERRDRIDQIARDEAAQWRWSRADEESFRRTVASYGVEFDPSTKSLRWSRFRQLASLDNKSDDALTDYLKAFMAMCKRQCRLTVGEAELPTRSDLKAEPIGEERAIATLERIDLLRVLREEVSPHPALEARLARCERSPDAPAWWSPAAHDRLLVRAVCRHGLGDTYHKLFCDPKLPFAECAKKWAAANKMRTRSDKMSSDEEDDTKDEDSGEKSSKSAETSSKAGDKSSEPKDDDDTDALSELETLAKLGRSEELPSPSLWFGERALESRLHHIAHTVQNARDRKHIAIDVETERAKLHALLSSPSPAHAPPPRDDSSDSSRRSTPAPPPAHQRPPPSPAPGVSKASPVESSAPLDLSDAQDLSRRTPAPSPATAPSPAPTPAPSPGKSRLDDTLSRLMKRKNVPEQEVIVGKEKKRKKLDEIVLGLSAAKGQAAAVSRPAPARTAPPAPVPAPARRLYPASPAPSPLVPHAPHKEPASFLQQSLESGAKARPPAPKPFSQEAKVDKWLAEQAAERRRPGAPTPRLAPDEHVPVVHRVTGKRLVGHKAPQLKHLTQWIAENPLYDIDTKWTDGIKEHVKLPADARAPPRAPHPPAPERKKGRPPSLDASAAHLNPALLASLSGLGGFDQKSLAATLSNLTGFDAKALGGFDPKLLASLNGYDPKNDPLLGSFNGVPNLLGNLTGGGLFSNLAGLGLSGFPGVDAGAGQVGADSKAKSRKHADAGGKGAGSQFPFGFPNPNMLYPQLGLSGLNPFGMQAAGLSSAYDALGLLNSGLVTSAASFPSASTSRGKTSAPRAATASVGAAQARAQKAHSDRHNAQRLLLPPDTHLLESLSKQCMSYDLPSAKPDKRSRETEAPDPSDFSKMERKKHHEPSRSRLPPELAAFQERLLKGDKRDVDISKMLLEQMASGALSASLVSSAESKRAFEAEREVSEKMTKNITDYSTKTVGPEVTHKRRRDETTDEPENLVMPPADAGLVKRAKDADERERPARARAPEERPAAHSAHTADMDLEDLIAPSTVIRTGAKPNAADMDKNKTDLANILSKNEGQSASDLSTRPLGEAEYGRRELSELDLSKDNQEPKDPSSPADAAEEEASEAGRRRRKGRKSSEEGAWGGARRELRSSAGRSAR